MPERTESRVIADAWQEYARIKYPSGSDPATLAAAQAAFYFGAWCTVQALEDLREEPHRELRTDVALNALRGEIESVIGERGGAEAPG